MLSLLPLPVACPVLALFLDRPPLCRVILPAVRMATPLLLVNISHHCLRLGGLTIILVTKLGVLQIERGWRGDIFFNSL